MKIKIFNIFLLFFLFSSVLYYFSLEEIPKTYKIVKVLEADEFYVDFNSNNKPDDNELVKIKDVVAFKSNSTAFVQKTAQELGMDVVDYLKLGLLSKIWAQDNLLNKEIKIKKSKTCFAKYACNISVEFQNKDLAQLLLENGLAHLKNNVWNKKYYEYYSKEQIEQNLSELSKIEFLLKNKKTNVVHDLKCKHALNSNTELIFKNELNYSNLTPCNYCLNLEVQNKVSNSKEKYDKSFEIFDGEIDLYLINPLEFIKPNFKCETNICKRLLHEINNSKKSIDLALYGISNQDELINALKSAQNRGVKIRIVTDLSKNSDMAYPETLALAKDFSLKTDKTTTLMHNKFIIFDEKLVFSGSVNISSSGTGGYNANSAVFIKNIAVVKRFLEEFNQMYSGKFSVNKVQNIKNDNEKISVYFSPKDDIFQNVVLPNIQNAKKNIYVSIFYLTYQDLISELIYAKKRNVDVMVMIDALGAINFKNRIELLRKAGIPVIVENWGGKNHEKTILIDNEKIILGSCNFSRNGFYKNDENVILINNKKLAQKYSDYYLYLFNSIDKKYLYSIPRTESFESKNSCFDGLDNNHDGFIDFKDEGCKKQ